MFLALAKATLDYKRDAGYRWAAMNLFLDIIYKYMGHPPYIDEQREVLWRFLNDDDPFAWIASRGASKTEIFLIGCIIVCLAEPGTPGRWLSGDTDQLEEAQDKSEKLKDVVGYTHRHSKIAHHFEIRFPNRSKVDFNPTTKTSGPRRFLLVRDEGGKIFDADVVKRFKEADGMLQGTWRYKKRDRYCSTPSVGSAFDGIDDVLVRDNKALVHDYHHFPWLRVDEQYVIETRGEPFLNCEYKCIKDAPGGKIFKYFKVIEDAAFKPMDTDICIVGTDWNGGWGHAGLAVYYRPGDGVFYAYDEYRSLAIRPPVAANDAKITDKSGLSMVEWMANLKKTVVDGNFMVISEEQGLNYCKDLIDLGITPVIPEAWTGTIQRARIPLTVSLAMREKIVVCRRCKALIIQMGTVHYAPKGTDAIPDQVDHHVDCLHHVVKVRVVGQAALWVH